MLFNKESLIEKIGQKAGFLFSYLLFTTVAYYILSFTNRLPENFTYFHIIPFTLLVVLIGFLIDKWLK